ncbi:SOS response-associated peptidase [Gordonia sp. CPCC 205333]|uniref:SOS response-associated peptidase n=1 Tax=Gordonia sp. CPCC 205333 TaxID=3140790 RepID=UPI003AF3E871
MCGRYAVTTDPAKLAAEIDAVNEVPMPEPPADLDAGKEAQLTLDGSSAEVKEPRPPFINYNVAPTTTIMTVVSRHSHEDPDDDPTLRIRAMRWGLVPTWAKEIGKGSLFNARAESVGEKASFRGSVKSKRCLIPMDGWYEWKKVEVAGSSKPAKVPYFMHPRDGTRLFMAGLWSVWRPRDADRDEAPLLSTTILTTDSVGPLRDIHDRMPLIMPLEDWDAWLTPDTPAPAQLYNAPALALAEAIDIREVSSLVNRVSNNGPELLAAVE